MRRLRDLRQPDRRAAPPPLPDLNGPQVTARLARLGDAERLLAFHTRNVDHLRRWSPPVPEDFLTIGYWRRWTSAAKTLFDQDRSMRLVLHLRHDEDSRLVGQINLSNIQRGAMAAGTVGYQIDRSLEGRGLMAEAMGMAVDFCFGPFGLHRIIATYMPENRRSAALLRRLGFEVEGYARDYLFIDGQWRDHVLTSLIAPIAKDPCPLSR